MKLEGKPAVWKEKVRGMEEDKESRGTVEWNWSSNVMCVYEYDTVNPTIVYNHMPIK